MVNLATLVPILVNGCNTLIIQIFSKIPINEGKPKVEEIFTKVLISLSKNVKNFPSNHILQ
jgi:hypothetical protein